MSVFGQDHQAALDELRDTGLPATFRKTTSTYDEATDTWSEGATSEVSGLVLQTRGDPRKYEALALVESEAPTLLFVPYTRGELPELGAVVRWPNPLGIPDVGTAYSVADVDPVAPDGRAIMARIIVKRGGGS